MVLHMCIDLKLNFFKEIMMQIIFEEEFEEFKLRSFSCGGLLKKKLEYK